MAWMRIDVAIPRCINFQLPEVSRISNLLRIHNDQAVRGCPVIKLLTPYGLLHFFLVFQKRAREFDRAEDKISNMSAHNFLLPIFLKLLHVLQCRNLFVANARAVG